MISQNSGFIFCMQNTDTSSYAQYQAFCELFQPPLLVLTEPFSKLRYRLLGLPLRCGAPSRASIDELAKDVRYQHGRSEFRGAVESGRNFEYRRSWLVLLTQFDKRSGLTAIAQALADARHLDRWLPPIDPDSLASLDSRMRLVDTRPMLQKRRRFRILVDVGDGSLSARLKARSANGVGEVLSDRASVGGCLIDVSESIKFLPIGRRKTLSACEFSVKRMIRELQQFGVSVILCGPRIDTPHFETLCRNVSRTIGLARFNLPFDQVKSFESKLAGLTRNYQIVATRMPHNAWIGWPGVFPGNGVL